MPEIMRETDGFGQRVMKTEYACDRPTDLCDLHRVRESRAVQISFMIDEDLGLVDEPSKRIGVNDAVTITLKLAA